MTSSSFVTFVLFQELFSILFCFIFMEYSKQVNKKIVAFLWEAAGPTAPSESELWRRVVFFNGFNYFYKLLWKHSGKRVVATRYRSRKWWRKESEQASERWCNWIFMQLLTNCITDGQHLTVAAILLVISSMQAAAAADWQTIACGLTRLT